MSPQRRLAGEYSGSRRAHSSRRRGGSAGPRPRSRSRRPAQGERVSAHRCPPDQLPAAGKRSQVQRRGQLCPRAAARRVSSFVRVAKMEKPPPAPPARPPSRDPPLCAPVADVRGPGRFGFSEKRNVADARYAGRAFLRAGALFRAAQGPRSAEQRTRGGRDPGSRGRGAREEDRAPGEKAKGRPVPDPTRWPRSRGAGGRTGVDGRPPGRPGVAVPHRARAGLSPAGALHAPRHWERPRTPRRLGSARLGSGWLQVPAPPLCARRTPLAARRSPELTVIRGMFFLPW